MVLPAKTLTNLGQEVNLRLTGVTFLVTVTARNADGTPINLTGASIASQIRGSDGALIAEMVPTITSALTGVFTLELPHAVASAMSFTRASYDVRLTDSLGRTFQLMRGRVLHEKETTQ